MQRKALDFLAREPSLEAAAQSAAGNWSRWDCFVWFGETNVPAPESVCLFYTQSFISGNGYVSQEAVHQLVYQRLSPYFGDGDCDGLVWPIRSSFCGDLDMLRGFCVRVYRDGKITEPFSKLYELVNSDEYRTAEDEEDTDDDE